MAMRSETVGTKLSIFENTLNGILEGTPSEEEQVQLRRRLIKEERLELEVAMIDLLNYHKFGGSNPTQLENLRMEVLKEMCDVVYVVVGSAEALGMKFDTAFNIVHKNNMLKLEDPHLREDGKLEKPSGHEKVNLKGLV